MPVAPSMPVNSPFKYYSMMLYWISFLLGAVGALALRAFASKCGFIDRPNERSSHDKPTPKGGGIGILAAVAAAALVLRISPAFWIPAALLALMSLWGDRFEISPKVRLSAQFIAAFCIVLFSGNGFTFPVALIIFFVVFVVSTANCFNFMDGINGIAAITGTVGFGLLAWFIFLSRAQDNFFILSLCVAAACIGFLPFNMPRAMVFMGDAGSVLLGFVFAAIVVLLSRNALDFVSMAGFLFPFYADELITMAIRLRRGENLMKPHRKHLYQLAANELGIDHWKISVAYGIVQAFIGSCILAARPFGLWIVIIIIVIFFGGFVAVYRYALKRVAVTMKSAAHIPAAPDSFRVLALLTDAFGGHGGIALYNRDLLTAICSHPGCTEVVAIPRLMPNPCEPLPGNLTHVTEGLNGKTRYAWALVNAILAGGKFDLVICAHINLLPLAWLASRFCRAPLLLEIYGIDAWQPPRSSLSRLLAGRIDAFVSISRVTSERFMKWTMTRRASEFLLPNAIHLEKYGAGPKSPELLRRFGLEGKTIVMTFGRLVSQERGKGFDEVLRLLPELAQEYPGIAYLIAGSGPDQPRLERFASDLGVGDRTVFTGMVPEAQKADYFRLADAYVMPSSGEGFGFVFLEAMACGIPVVASKIDGSREAVREGLLGEMVDPGNSQELAAAIRRALQRPRGVIPDGLDFFSYVNFAGRLHAIIDAILKGRGL